MIPSTDHMLLYSETRSSDCRSEQTRQNVARYASASPLLLDRRLDELSREWWAERVCTATLSVAAFMALALPLALGMPWIAAPAVLLALLALQALFAWSPVMPLLRVLGYRTACEIWNERYALKALRGDFHHLDAVATPQDLVDLSRFEGEGGPTVPEPVLTASHSTAVHNAVEAAKS